MNNEIHPITKALREFRIIAILCLSFMIYLAYYVSDWYMMLKEPNNSQGAFASAVVLACVGVLKYWVETSANDTHLKGSNNVD